MINGSYEIQKDSRKYINTSSQVNMTHSVISFFAGCGGLDLGLLGGFEFKGELLERLPFDIRAAYDHDEKCIVTYKQNIGEHGEVRDLANAEPSSMPAADVLIGGFPCQDFPLVGLKQVWAPSVAAFTRPLSDTWKPTGQRWF